MIPLIRPDIPESLLNKWQDLLNTLAKSFEVPAALIMRVHESEIEVFLSSKSEGNPYQPGDREELGIGLYCETVMNENRELHVADALSDPEWSNNPDIKLGMTYYLGYPLLWPDNTPFGTICVLDNKDNVKATKFKSLMAQFQDFLNNDLKFLCYTLNREQELRNALLKEAHHHIKNELQAIRAIIKMETKKLPEKDNLFQGVFEKIEAIIKSFHFRTVNYDSKISFKKLIDSILEGFIVKKDPVNISLQDIENWYIEPKHIMKVQLVVSELITNALKHQKDKKSEVKININKTDKGPLIRIFNFGSLPETFDFNEGNGLGNGLQLASKILPSNGSDICLYQCEDQVCTEILLSSPLLSST